MAYPKSVQSVIDNCERRIDLERNNIERAKSMAPLIKKIEAAVCEFSGIDPYVDLSDVTNSIYVSFRVDGFGEATPALRALRKAVGERLQYQEDRVDDFSAYRAYRLGKSVGAWVYLRDAIKGKCHRVKIGEKETEVYRTIKKTVPVYKIVCDDESDSTPAVDDSTEPAGNEVSTNASDS